MRSCLVAPVRARRLAPLILLLLLLPVSACAPELSASLVKPPPGQEVALVLGAVEADDPEAMRLARLMREAMLGRLLRAGAFAVIYDRDGPAAGPGALLVEGAITEADRGSDAWRFIAGSGLGRPRLAVTFRILDADGSARAVFAAASNEPGPAGLAGHWRPLSMDQLARGLGATAADAIVRWSRGEELAAVGWLRP